MHPDMPSTYTQRERSPCVRNEENNKRDAYRLPDLHVCTTIHFVGAMEYDHLPRQARDKTEEQLSDKIGMACLSLSAGQVPCG
eukprot:COSAG06_NODE_4235_length_4443_cov_194.471915_4_plen_83_part_00